MKKLSFASIGFQDNISCHQLTSRQQSNWILAGTHCLTVGLKELTERQQRGLRSYICDFRHPLFRHVSTILRLFSKNQSIFETFQHTKQDPPTWQKVEICWHCMRKGWWQLDPWDILRHSRLCKKRVPGSTGDSSALQTQTQHYDRLWQFMTRLRLDYWQDDITI